MFADDFFTRAKRLASNRAIFMLFNSIVLLVREQHRPLFFQSPHALLLEIEVGVELLLGIFPGVEHASLKLMVDLGRLEGRQLQNALC